MRSQCTSSDRFTMAESDRIVEKYSVYSVREDLANGRATIVPKSGGKHGTGCWQVFGQVCTLDGERLPFVACRQCLLAYTDDPSGSTGNLHRHLAKCEKRSSGDNQQSYLDQPNAATVNGVALKSEPVNYAYYPKNTCAIASTSNAYGDVHGAAASVRNGGQESTLSRLGNIRTSLVCRELQIIPKAGVKQTTECWQVFGQVCTLDGELMPFVACRRCLQVYSDGPDGSTGTLNRHLAKCFTTGNIELKLRSPKEEEPEERPMSSSISLQDADMPMPEYQDDAEEEVELDDQTQLIGQAALQELFGTSPPIANGATNGGEWSCEVSGCPLTFFTRNGMLKHCRNKHKMRKRTIYTGPYPPSKDQFVKAVTPPLVPVQAEAVVPVILNSVMSEHIQTSSVAVAETSTPRLAITTASSPRIRCDVDGCARMFLTSNGMRKHRRKRHFNIQQMNCTIGQFNCGFCSEVVTSMTALCAHLLHAHNQPTVEETRKFRSKIEFETWLLQYEQTAGRFVEYVDGEKQNLRCRYNGSHSFLWHAVKQCAFRGPFTCSAFMNIYELKATGEVHVSCCLHHYGHVSDGGQLVQPAASSQVASSPTLFDRLLQQDVTRDGPTKPVQFTPTSNPDVEPFQQTASISPKVEAVRFDNGRAESAVSVESRRGQSSSPSVTPSASQAHMSWLEEIGISLQAIRACAVACQNSDRGRLRISEAVDELWDICDKARRDAKLEKQRSRLAQSHE